MIMMIKLTKINKYFNKGKSNQIHVIDDTSIIFPEKGLVALTGPSGCGKTTLLNVIGGLDKFGSGEIAFDEQIIRKYKPLELDVLRNLNIGYIFQNYNLIDDKTVYENIEIALNMAGLYNKEEIEERINYVLEAVGMYNYRRRNVKALSGGQQQRIAIARAIAKNPKVVLADEPTGNLDANNTFEVMSIIKKISQGCLVILVSHEKHLVDFYADRVIEISDGKIINDYDNAGNRSFDHVDDRNIYLKDLNKDGSLETDNIIRYFDADKDDSLSFEVVEVKDTIYIKANSQSMKKIKYITEDTEIKLIDDHYKARQTEDALDYTFDLEQYGDIEHPKKKKSFIRLVDTMKHGFQKATSRRKFIGWLFLIAYFVISALVVYQLSTFASLNRLDEREFLNIGKDLISVSSNQGEGTVDIDEILNSVDNIEFSPYYREIEIRMFFSDYYQGNAYAFEEAYPIRESWADSDDLILGRMPNDNLEIVIDEWVAEELIGNKSLADLGVESIEDLIGHNIQTVSMFRVSFEIVGIIQTESPIVVVTDEAIYSFLNDFNYITWGSAENRIEILSGEEIQAEDEILVGSNYEVELGDTMIINEVTYTIVGTYEVIDSDGNIESYYSDAEAIVVPNIVAEEFVKNKGNEIFNYNNSGIYFYSDDIEQAISDINDSDDHLEAFNSYESQRAYAIEKQRSEISSRIQSVLITLIGIIVYIFFMMRSSMLSRIKEIGIYRAIGATKRDIYKIFIGEIFWFTTLGSLTGYLLMSFLINRVQNMLGNLISVFYFPIHYFIGGIIGIYLINLIFGLLPIFSLLRKTPSEINSKFDI